MNIVNRKWLVVVIILIVFGILIAVAGWMFNRQPAHQVAPFVSFTPPTPVSNTDGMKTYINAEFGFEFHYPQNWEVKENIYGSPFSKFNLIVTPTQEKYLPDPILFNITTLEFVSRSFSDLEDTVTKVVVGGIVGKKYEYEFESMQRISIILPFGEYQIILGTEKQYESIFNQVLATFKLLK